MTLINTEILYSENVSDKLFMTDTPTGEGTNLSSRSNEGEISDPQKIHPSYTHMSIKWELIKDVLEGTFRMKEWALTTWKRRQDITSRNLNYDTFNLGLIDYFPIKPFETSHEYYLRAQNLQMTQYLGKTIRTFKAMVFRKPAFLTDAKNKKLADLAKNINFEGDDLNTFGQKVLETALKKGVAYIYVQNAREQEVESLDEFSSKIKTWFTLIQPEDVINWSHSLNEENQLKLEYVLLNLGMKDDIPVRVWVHRDGRYIIYHGKSNNNGFEIYKEGFHGFGEVPLYEVMSSMSVQSEKFVVTPPFIEMAWAQIKDMNKKSDLDHGEAISCYTSMYICTSNAEEVNFGQGLGVNRVLIIPDTDAKVGQIMTNAAGLAEARKGIQENKSRIFEEGINFVTDKKAHTRTTATEISNDRELQSSPLTDTVLNMQNAFNKALDMFKKMELITGEDEQKAVFKFNNDINLLTIDANTATLLSKMQALGQISYETFLECLKRGEILPHDIDVASEVKRVQGDLSQTISSLNPETNPTDVPDDRILGS